MSFVAVFDILPTISRLLLLFCSNVLTPRWSASKTFNIASPHSLLQMARRKNPSVRLLQKCSLGLHKRSRALLLGWDAQKVRGSLRGATMWQQVCCQQARLSSLSTPSLEWRTQTLETLLPSCCFPTGLVIWDCHWSILALDCVGFFHILCKIDSVLVW